MIRCMLRCMRRCIIKCMISKVYDKVYDKVLELFLFGGRARPSFGCGRFFLLVWLEADGPSRHLHEMVIGDMRRTWSR